MKTIKSGVEIFDIGQVTSAGACVCSEDAAGHYDPGHPCGCQCGCKGPSSFVDNDGANAMIAVQAAI